MNPARGAHAVALSMLPGCGHHRLRALLGAAGHEPELAWLAIASGHTGDLDLSSRFTLGPDQAGLLARWKEAAAAIDPHAVQRALHRERIGVWLAGDEGAPAVLVDDPDPPPLLFWRGDPAAADAVRPAAAIVGTRRCTAYGRDVARQLGRDLALAGVRVVSGLALGIDGAGHQGALAAGSTNAGAPPVAVVGSGLDVVYPTRHRALWDRVAEAGILLGEAPPGARPEAWRFPRRNRILAALSDVVIVVESHASGGSLSTVRAAIERGITVMAVPGSVRSPSSVGTNRLLADGAAPVTDVDDVLVALSLEGRAPGAGAAGGFAADAELVDDPVLAAVDWTPTATEEVLRRTGLSIVQTTTQLTRLEVRGLVRRRGGWWERVGEPGLPADRGYTAST